jgi:hypothetical protein
MKKTLLALTGFLAFNACPAAAEETQKDEGTITITFEYKKNSGTKDADWGKIREAAVQITNDAKKAEAAGDVSYENYEKTVNNLIQLIKDATALPAFNGSTSVSVHEATA